MNSMNFSKNSEVSITKKDNRQIVYPLHILANRIKESFFELDARDIYETISDVVCRLGKKRCGNVEFLVLPRQTKLHSNNIETFKSEVVKEIRKMPRSKGYSDSEVFETVLSALKPIN